MKHHCCGDFKIPPLTSLLLCFSKTRPSTICINFTSRKSSHVQIYLIVNDILTYVNWLLHLMTYVFSIFRDALPYLICHYQGINIKLKNSIVDAFFLIFFFQVGSCIVLHDYQISREASERTSQKFLLRNSFCPWKYHIFIIFICPRKVQCFQLFILVGAWPHTRPDVLILLTPHFFLFTKTSPYNLPFMLWIPIPT